MKVTETTLPGLLLIEPEVFGDARGYFLEFFNAERYGRAGIPGPFVQDNLSRSSRGVLRGLHYQNPHQQGKLVTVLDGEVFDVAVDLRARSTTLGRWYGARLSSENKRQLYVPPGFAHGFLVMSDAALFAYKCTEYYRPDCERVLRWNDPDIGIEWPFDPVGMSERDRTAPILRDTGDVNGLPPGAGDTPANAS